MSDYITATDLTETFMRLVPTRDVEWPGGSAAAEYAVPTGRVLMLWDSHSNPILCDLRDAEHADAVWQEITTLDPERWDMVWDSIVADYPDGEAMTAGDLAYLLGDA
jgi:hypothetical protein